MSNASETSLEIDPFEIFRDFSLRRNDGVLYQHLQNKESNNFRSFFEPREIDVMSNASQISLEIDPFVIFRDFFSRRNYGVLYHQLQNKESNNFGISFEPGQIDVMSNASETSLEIDPFEIFRDSSLRRNDDCKMPVNIGTLKRLTWARLLNSL